MAKTVYGEVIVDFHKCGNWQDLADILLVNGYTLEIKMQKEQIPCKENKVTILIMKEV